MTGDARRPDPDALLRRVQSAEARKSRGRLKVFFGFAPGVGKTYRMLELARAAAERGARLVVGVVETHGRANTAALLEGLEVLPRRDVDYRGQTLTEFDLDGALALAPDVVLVDELAHTNAPGSRHAKRYQDVDELLRAGIDVWTTVNVQHVESLNDVVEQITGAMVRETLPDEVLDRADEVELVDLPPEDLIERLRDGRVYGAAQAERAERNFFRLGNLLALRELALRRTAERVDQDVRAYREEHAIADTWRSGERILVCAGPAPASARVIRAARRMAAGLRAPWSAIYVESPLTPLGEKDRDQLETHLRLAETLGASIVRLNSTAVADAILEHARRENVTKIVVGKPTHPRLRDRLRGSLLDALVRGSGDIEVHVIAGDRETDAPREPPPPRRRTTPLAHHAFTLTAVAATTGIALLLHRVFGLPDVEMLFVLTIMGAAMAWGRGASILASALSVAAYDFFFVPPYLTFAVAEARHVLTFVAMFGVGLVISTLVSRLKLQEEASRSREERTSAFFSLARDLAAATSAAEVASIFAAHVARATGAPTVLLIPDEGTLVARGAAPDDARLAAEDAAVARWAFDHALAAGRGTETLPASAWLCAPLRLGTETLGVVAIRPPTDEPFRGEPRELLEGLARIGALALSRATLAEGARASALKARTEEMRSALLSGVSHDLRTPLGAITGAATALRDDRGSLSEDQKRELVHTICEESSRMDRLASNLLDMTRLQSGPLPLRREWVPLEEILGSALTRMESFLENRPVRVTTPSTFGADGGPLAYVDPVLIEQVFVNLIENACKYSPPGTPITVTARGTERSIEILFADAGPGIPLAERERVFEKFHRSPGTTGSGFGLGLAICRGIVGAHGGSIVLVDGPEPGAAFLITLPRIDAPPIEGAPE